MQVHVQGAESSWSMCVGHLKFNLVLSTLIPHFKEITEFTSNKILGIQFIFNLLLQSYSLQNVTNLRYVRYVGLVALGTFAQL
jgi:hypothetical protein